jgi:hypothetical protein
MFDQSYSDNAFNTNLYPLLGYDRPEQDSFSLTNKFIQSWSFDGVLPLQAKYVNLWNKDLGEFNVKPGDYIYVLDEASGAYETKPVISIDTDPELSYFSAIGEEDSSATSSFTSNVFIEYLDERGLSKVKTIVTALDEQGFPSNQISVISENWNQKILGSSGWMISSSGNAIFNNIAVRGQIDATSGNFSGNLSVNNGEMKIGSGVSSTKSYSVSAFKILSNKVTLTVGTHTFAVGDIISVKNVDSLGAMAVAFPSNATITNVSGDGTQITYTASNTFSAGMRVQVTGVTPTEYNLTSAEVLSRNSTSFVVAGAATSSYVSGGSATVTSVPTNAVDINGEYVITDITSTKISYNFVANNFAETALSYGTAESAITNDGIFINDYNYWYDDGHFEIGDADSSVTWNPDISLLNITGNMSASQIRGTDVYANSAQLGGNEFGWVIGSGDIFSGTYGSTSYLKSGFYSIPVIDFEQETEVVNGKTIIKLNQVSGSGHLSGNSRGVFASVEDSTFTDLKVGYQLYETTSVNNIEVRGDFIGIVEEVVSTDLIKLKDAPSKFYDNIRFGAFYVNTTVTSQFTVFEKLPVDNSGNANLSFEGPAGQEYHASNIPVVVNSVDSRVITTKSIPPVWNADKTPKEYLSNSLFLSLSNVLDYKKESNITRIRTVQSILANGDEAYNSYIYSSNADDYVPGDVIFVSNISRYYDEVSALNGSYLPVIKVGEDSLGKYVLVYTDGYLGDSHNVQFNSFTVSSIQVESGEVTLETATTHRFDIGQTINISLFGVKKTGNSLDFYNFNEPEDLPFQDSGIITGVSNTTIKYRKNFTDLISSSVGSGSIAFSYPSMNTKESDKSYSLTVGSSKPDDAPFQIDQFGENVKIKNLEVTGSVTGFYYDIIELDDFSGSFDGRKNTFLPKYNQRNIVLDNPMRLSVSLNGVVQSAFIRNREYVWQTGFLSYKGYTVDGDGNLKFSESPPSGSTINVKVLPGPNKNKTSRIYPFKAVDVALG